MSTWFVVASLLLALVGAVAVVAFESPVRSAGGLITCMFGVASVAATIGAPLVPGYVLWVGGGGIGLLSLGAVLLLNLGEDERGKRRLRLKPALTAPFLALLWAFLAAPLIAHAMVPADLPPLTEAAAGQVIAEQLAVPFSIGLIALAAALIGAIALVRRRT